MGFSNGWLILICTVTIISAVIEAIIPETKIKKAYVFLASAVLIYVLLLPVINGRLSVEDIERLFSDNISVSQNFEDASSETTLRAVRQGCETLIAQKLSDQSIKADRIEIECKQKADSFEIEKITIYARLNENQRQICKDEIEKLFEEMPEVLFVEGE